MRTELLLGNKAMGKLKNSTVCIFGIGGVGSYVVEGLARSGIGNIVLVDYDTIDVTNINRQLHANFNTIGKKKTEIMKKRIISINPKCNVTIHDECLTVENIDQLIDTKYDYVVDAIDMVSSKLELIVKCKSMKIPIISCMGTGNKL